MRLSSVLSVLPAAQLAFGDEQRILEPSNPYALKESPLIKLHHELVDIKSTSGIEQDVGIFLVDYLKAQNLVVRIQNVGDEDESGNVSSFKPPGDLTPKRFNIYAHTGDSAKARVLLTSHIDTVPPHYGYSREGNTIKGRGTVDDKACVAAQILTLLSFPKEVQKDLALLFVVDEETGGLGMRTASQALIKDGLAFETVIFGEPTEGKLASGHKGNIGMTMRVQGRASHSGYPWLGTSANSIMIAAMAALEALADGKGQQSLPWSEKYGNTTLNLGRIEGGVALNVVPERAEASISLRLAAGTPNEVQKILKETISKAVEDKLGEYGSWSVEFTPGYGPVDLSCDLQELGFECVTVNYGTDVPNMQGDHKRYLYGPGSIQVAHSDHEALEVEELEQALVDYKKIVDASLSR